MAETLEGKLDAAGFRFAIVASRFNATVVERLLAGALDALARAGARAEDITVVRVPGSLELPLVARRLAASGHWHAIICLGAIIRGETPHFDYVAAEASSGIARCSYETGVPVIYGVLTTDTVEQAMDRAGLKGGNKGYDAALAAAEMASLMREIDKLLARAQQR